MEPIPETPSLFHEYLHRIKDLLVLDEEMLLQIRHFTKEEKMEIIVAMNQVILSLVSLLEP
jgi:hypothetical protein